MSYAQPYLSPGVPQQHFGDTGSFLLQGKIENFKGEYFEYAVTGFFDNEGSSVMVKKDGTFSKRISIENIQQDIFLYLNKDAITFTIKKNDTIALYWDENNFKNSFKINASKGRQNALDIQWLQYLKFRQPYFAISDKLYRDKTLNDSAKFHLINDLYNKELKLIIDSSKYSNFYLLYPGVYFRYSNILFSHSLMPKFSLIADTSFISDPAERMAIKYTLFSNLSEDLFWSNSNYRDFMYDYPRLYNLFNSFSGEGQDYFNPTLRNYYLAKGTMNIIPIKNWFITKCILDDYGWYKFNDVDSVNSLFQKELSDNYLKKLLIDKHNVVVTLKKGQQAPAFTLKNEKGENISLSDFKGKIVYIDFWGVGCGPCIYDIDHYGKKLHETYKDKNIVFISICVDSNEQQWKEGVQKHSMNDGINLIAEGWVKNPVCKKYNVSGIPHYILIDKEGKIVNNNASGMGRLLSQTGKNEIDELLSK